MTLSTSSNTAARTATYRAQHQVLDEVRVFDDPFAIRLLGDAAIEAIETPPQQSISGRAGLRAFLALRSRYAEDLLAQAVARGATQYVVLGAGLDTFALRNPFPGLEVIEIDHPATQAWKAERYAAAKLELPACLRLVAVDFTQDSLAAKLDEANVGAAFFSWLGVSYYLHRDALDKTLAAVASRGRGTELVLDWAQHRELLDEASQRYLDIVKERVGSVGEPFVSFFSPAELAALLASRGFSVLENEAYPLLYERLTSHSAPSPRGFGALAHARV